MDTLANTFEFGIKLGQADTVEKKRKLIDNMIKAKVPEEYIRMVLNTL